MLLFALLCQTLIDAPADALQPVNRSEIAVLAERIAALESAAAEREAKIDEFNRRMRETAFRHDPYGSKIPENDRRLGGFQWLQTSVRWRSDGDFALQQPESLGTLEPQPHRIRGTWHEFKHLRYVRPRERRSNHILLDRGSDIVEYWISPPLDFWSDPLKHGIVLGTDSFCLPHDEQSIFEAVDEIIRIYHESDLDRSIGRNAF